jgi:hypothetical protein
MISASVPVENGEAGITGLPVFFFRVTERTAADSAT